MAILKTEPEKFIKGDTVKWAKSIADYLPADGWVLSYAFVLEGATTDQQTTAGVDNGDGTHLITLTAAESAVFSQGIYHWQSYVTKGSERYTVGCGAIEIKPDFATLNSGYDNRSHVKKVLDGIEAVIENRASEEQNYIMIAGTQITNIPHTELLVLRSKYKMEYKREIQAQKLAAGERVGGGKVRVRF